MYGSTRPRTLEEARKWLGQIGTFVPPDSQRYVDSLADFLPYMLVINDELWTGTELSGSSGLAHAVEQHDTAIRMMMASSRVMSPPEAGGTLIRSAMESCALTYWLIHDQSLLQARSLTWRFHEATRGVAGAGFEKMVVELYGHDPEAQFRVLGQSADLRPDEDRLGRLIGFDDQRKPHWTALISECPLADDIKLFTADNHNYRTIYSYVSAAAHGEAWVRFQNRLERTHWNYRIAGVIVCFSIFRLAHLMLAQHGDDRLQRDRVPRQALSRVWDSTFKDKRSNPFTSKGGRPRLHVIPGQGPIIPG